MSDSLTSLLSGGLINTNVPNYSGWAKSSEARRQGIINLGLDQINAVFGGGSAPFYAPADSSQQFSKSEWRGASPQSKTFWTLNKKGQFSPFYAPNNALPANAGRSAGIGAAAGMIGGPVGSALGAGIGATIANMRNYGVAEGSVLGPAAGLFHGDVPTPRDIVNKKLRRGQLFNAPEEKTFEGFQQPFYDQRAQDYVNFALPQLGEQYRGTRNAINFGLANRGLSGSTQGGQANSALERQTGEARQRISDEGLSQANTLKRGVEDARQQAINQLYQSADPAQALQGAVRNALNFQQPSTFAPISNMFTNIAQQYATNRLLNSYRQPFGMPEEDALSNYLAPI